MDAASTMGAPAPVPENHPLRAMFRALVARAFQGTLGLSQPEISLYVANILTEFAHRDNIYQVRNAQGVRLMAVAEMLADADVMLNAESFDRERAVHKHIGDFTLFWAGVYPEFIGRLRLEGSADHLINYVEQGKKSYHIVSTFHYGKYADDASLFRMLSQEFELCVYGLSLVRHEWEQLTTR